ncbi:hypothetical protein OOJ96_17900 [Pseudomonas sp. 15FMM2]|uniref:Uncharacterized protein n=1 Tax=Pseudomonas imrae TaxID=2992837 RepID=A0ACC7PI65_9PSED
MSKFARRTWNLVVNSLRVYHVWKYLRDSFDDRKGLISGSRPGFGQGGFFAFCARASTPGNG